MARARRNEEDGDGPGSGRPPRKKKRSWTPVIIIAVVSLLVGVVGAGYVYHIATKEVIDGRVAEFVKSWNRGEVTECQSMYMYKTKDTEMRDFGDLIAFIKRRRPDLEEPYRIETTMIDEYTFEPKRERRARAYFVLEADKGGAKQIRISTIWRRRGGYGWFIWSWGAKEK